MYLALMRILHRSKMYTILFCPTQLQKRLPYSDSIGLYYDVFTIISKSTKNNNHQNTKISSKNLQSIK